MWRWVWLAAGLGGCAYVSRDEYLAYWDVDGDGWPLEEDCAPDDPDVFPYAPDRRGDGCDTDCGTEPDADGDDWPLYADCDEADDSVFPCSPFEVEDDGRDSDCDGFDSKRADLCPGLDPDYPAEQTYPPCPEGA